MRRRSFIKPTNSFIRFLLVGVINTCVGLFIIFFLLNVLHLSYWVSTFVGNLAGACISYLLNRSYTFNSTVSIQKGLPRFLTIILICYFGAYFCSEKLMIWFTSFHFENTAVEQNGAVLLGSVLYTISNYLGQKYFVFNTVKTA
ncbi:GtrA family protein [Neobacillus niacini]|uniref:GtrA family protein n=1 Tax=Neobacillus niacini TaxID=86668 RepID=UPI00203D96F6|nr:GtrA family protein [Neobacillus niacini]MCM3691568.1 GtrA family protein [Neobacillus niacini]